MAKGKKNRAELDAARTALEFSQVSEEDAREMRNHPRWKMLNPSDDNQTGMALAMMLTSDRMDIDRVLRNMNLMSGLNSVMIALNSAKDQVQRSRLRSDEAVIAAGGLNAPKQITEKSYSVFADYTNTEVSAAEGWTISPEASLGTSGTAELSVQVTPDGHDDADNTVRQTLASFAVKLVSGTASTARGILAEISPPSGLIIKPVEKDSYPPRVEVNLDSLATDGYIPNVALFAWMQINTDGVLTGVFIGASAALTVEQTLRLRVGVVQPKRPEVLVNNNSDIYIRL